MSTDEASASSNLAVDDELSLVFVGLLYGQKELAAELREPEETPDARLILAAYRRWGLDFASKLDGDFSFVLHDAKEPRALCVRDALGMHPLCYNISGPKLVVASEPRQILATGVSSEPSKEAIALYLATTRHLYGGNRTYFRDVLKVEPGQLLTVGASESRTIRHWQIDPNHQIDETTDEEIAGTARALMIDAVKRRIPKKGPYAAALTGGFDSSSVSAMLLNALRDEGRQDVLETFSFELRDQESDEAELIDAVSKELGTNHHHLYLDQDNVFEVLTEMIEASQGPTFDMGLLYLWRKKESAAQRDVRVMLSGLGGDELFAGQFHYLADLLRSLQLRTLWQEIRGLYPVNQTTARRSSLRRILSYYVFGPLVPRGAKNVLRTVINRRGPVPPWIDPVLADSAHLAERISVGAERVFADAYRQDCHEVFTHSLVNVTLPLHESLGAAFGIETRFPLLDRRLVEFMFAAPRDQKIRGGRFRIAQRRAMEGILPEVVITNHIKKNLNPVLRRQQQGHFVAEVKRLFEAKNLLCEEYLDPVYLRHCHQQALNGSLADGTTLPLWYAMNLERWLKSIR